MSWLINAAQLEKFKKSQKNLIIFDASLHMDSQNNSGKAGYLEKHIIDANYFDIDSFSEPNNENAHTLISNEEEISKKLGELGIRNDFKIVFYDNSQLHSASRALWMMKVFGHNPHLLYILDGGLQAWEKSGKKTASGETKITPRQYKAKLQLQYVKSLDQIKQNLKQPKEQIVDVRHPARFAGGAEPRANMRSGHIPGSYSFPYNGFFDKDGAFLPLDKIRTRLISVGIDLKSPIIATCGAAITAPILDFILDISNHKNHTVYAGSWTEWGAEKLYPGEKSLAERPVDTCLEEVDVEVKFPLS